MRSVRRLEILNEGIMAFQFFFAERSRASGLSGMGGLSCLRSVIKAKQAARDGR
jgi:hypothetical protein